VILAVIAVIVLVNPFPSPPAADDYITLLADRLTQITNPEQAGPLPLVMEFWAAAGEPGDNPNCGHVFDFDLFASVPGPPDELAADRAVVEAAEFLNQGLALLRHSVDTFQRGCEQADLPALAGEGHGLAEQAAQRFDEAGFRIGEIMRPDVEPAP